MNYDTLVGLNTTDIDAEQDHRPGDRLDHQRRRQDLDLHDPPERQVAGRPAGDRRRRGLDLQRHHQERHRQLDELHDEHRQKATAVDDLHRAHRLLDSPAGAAGQPGRGPHPARARLGEDPDEGGRPHASRTRRRSSAAGPSSASSGRSRTTSSCRPTRTTGGGAPARRRGRLRGVHQRRHHGRGHEVRRHRRLPRAAPGADADAVARVGRPGQAGVRQRLRRARLQLLHGRSLAGQPRPQGLAVPPGAAVGGRQEQAVRDRLRRHGQARRHRHHRQLLPQPRLALDAAGRPGLQLQPGQGLADADGRRLQAGQRRPPRSQRQAHLAAPLRPQQLPAGHHLRRVHDGLVPPARPARSPSRRSTTARWRATCTTPSRASSRPTTTCSSGAGTTTSTPAPR